MSLPPPPSLDILCEGALHLPAAPTLLPRLMAALQNDRSTAAEIGNIIRVDSALAAATLRLANSAYYAPAEPVASLELAIVMLGQKETFKIASVTAIIKWESVHHASLPWEPGDYGRHSLCTAMAAEVLAETSGGIVPQVAYTAGLVGDLGKLVMAYACASHYPAVSAWAVERRSTWEEAERAVFGYDHSEVGARLLRLWRFPEEFAQAVQFQFNPGRAPSAALPLLAHLHAARYLAVSLGPGVTEGGFLFSLQGGFLTEWGFTPELFEKAMIEVRDRAFCRLGDALSIGLFRA